MSDLKDPKDLKDLKDFKENRSPLPAPRSPLIRSPLIRSPLIRSPLILFLFSRGLLLVLGGGKMNRHWR